MDVITLPPLAAVGGVYAPTLADFNDPRAAITAIVSTLGDAPEGAEADLTARLDAIETALAGMGGGGGSSSGPTFTEDIGADVNGGPGWTLFHTAPPIVASSAVIFDYEFYVSLGAGYPNKSFQYIVTSDATAPSNNRVNGAIGVVMPNNVNYDYWKATMKGLFSGSGSLTLRFWGRFNDFDPTPNAAYASTGVSFIVKKAHNNQWGAFRGLLWGV